MSRVAVLWISFVLASAAFATEPLTAPSPEIHTRSDAAKFGSHAKGALAPLYAYLAQYLVDRYDLATRSGIGVDLGGGPGDTILELARRTQAMYWIDADINPHHFEYLYQDVGQAALAHRVGAVFADAQLLPFRDGYADIIVSRGSFHFWGDPGRAFAEIHRVLKPGGSAFIGRGLSPNVPVEVARSVRARQNGGPQYDVDETAALFSDLMSRLGIETYEIVRPLPKAEVNYGIWLAFTKASGAPDAR